MSKAPEKKDEPQEEDNVEVEGPTVPEYEPGKFHGVGGVYDMDEFGNLKKHK